jgi:hypothetical protein
MKKILIYIDDWISSEAILESLSRLAFVQAAQLDITLVKTYLVGCVDTELAVIENDRVKSMNMKILEAHQEAILKAKISYKINIFNKVNMGTEFNVLPRLIETSDFDLIIVGNASVDLITRLSKLAKKSSFKFPLIIICSEEKILLQEPIQETV